MQKVVIFNLVNSSNCGDKLIAQVLKSQFEPKFSVLSRDILGNQADSGFYSVRRRFSAFIVPILPRFFRRFLVRFCAFFKFRIIKSAFYTSSVRTSDFVVIGGGQLFRDNDSYMACALDSLFRAIKKYEKPFFVLGCGASGLWSPYTKKVFKRIFESHLNKKTVFRDENSIQILQKNGISGNFSFAPDLAFALGFKNHAESGDFFGICVTSPRTILYYGRESWKKSAKIISKRILEAVEEKIAGEQKILIFCNGNPEDFFFAKSLVKKIRKKYPQKDFLVGARAKNPADLENLLSRCRKVFSFRMHAAILCALLKIPCELERWDSKTDGLNFDEKTTERNILAAKSVFSFCDF